MNNEKIISSITQLLKSEKIVLPINYIYKSINGCLLQIDRRGNDNDE
ncbi:hypothetical protein SAMN02745724_02527 [Pseudoalteromonas denitrificans DSM 6059]|uniref:Uncharacterized protein n=1 Tax=Pseudoalteromonas denitrificans DSM 6059 TaxID=1123010 RepID=A0A1I1LZL8_9GAMM|nr:hypothetical protein SAMN02745724_02527 [Pseudoalteromonas denitrificans DSM 6059]